MSDYERRINPTTSSQGRKLEYQDVETYREAEAKAIEDIKKEFASAPRTMTLPTDSDERKNYPLHRGCLKYFPAALAGVAKISKLGNDKHNPGQDLHHARGKSTDHADCIIRHLIDTTDLIAAKSRGQKVSTEDILTEVNQMAWRVLALSQELHEEFGAPIAPGAKV